MPKSARRRARHRADGTAWNSPLLAVIDGPVRIDDIQNFVERELVNDHLYDIAKDTSYRLDSDIRRAKASDVNEAIKKLVNKDESFVRENANKDSN